MWAPLQLEKGTGGGKEIRRCVSLADLSLWPIPGTKPQVYYTLETGQGAFLFSHHRSEFGSIFSILKSFESFNYIYIYKCTHSYTHILNVYIIYIFYIFNFCIYIYNFSPTFGFIMLSLVLETILFTWWQVWKITFK